MVRAHQHAKHLHVHLQGRIAGIQADLWYRGNAPLSTAMLQYLLACHAGLVGCHVTAAT